MIYTDDPHANWNFDSRSKRPPRVTAKPPEPPPQPAVQDPPSETWARIFTAVLDALLPYKDAYAVVRQLTEDLLHQLTHNPGLPRPVN